MADTNTEQDLSGQHSTIIENKTHVVKLPEPVPQMSEIQTELVPQMSEIQAELVPPMPEIQTEQVPQMPEMKVDMNLADQVCLLQELLGRRERRLDSLEETVRQITAKAEV